MGAAHRKYEVSYYHDIMINFLIISHRRARERRRRRSGSTNQGSSGVAYFVEDVLCEIYIT